MGNFSAGDLEANFISKRARDRPNLGMEMYDQRNLIPKYLMERSNFAYEIARRPL